MKAAIIYSGKGGVGKTTTTANIARVLCKKYKVFVLDMDINTPSMNTEFKGEHPEENLWVHSTGNIFDKFIFLEKSMVERFILSAKQKIREIKPDIILIDTPPSITQTHIEVLRLVTVSVIIFVSQPTALSREDVIRTASFFKERCQPCVEYLVENMCYGDNISYDYGIDVIARIPLMDGFKSEQLIERCGEQYEIIGEKILLGADVEQKNTFHKPQYDETFDICRLYQPESYRRKHAIVALIKRDGEEGEKEMVIGMRPQFLSVRTWDKMLDYIDTFQQWPGYDQRVANCTTERIKRMVEPFYESEQAYFMVTNAPHCEIRLVTGEIGQATLLTGEKGHFGIPRVKYQTRNGEIVLFPDEIRPVSIEEIQSFLSEGYVIINDGRYLPPKETVKACYEYYGSRVGLCDNWEQIYDEWIK